MELHKVLYILMTFFASSQILGVDSYRRQNSPITLVPLNINCDRITVSGYSSGGTMAQHMQVSHSSLIAGMAVFNHAFYRCGPGDGNIDTYDNACTSVGPLGPTSPQYPPERAITDIQSYAKARLIDDPVHLHNKPLYVYVGLKSSTNLPATSLAILTVFEPFIRNPSKIRTQVQSAGRVVPTNNKKFGACDRDASNNFHAAYCGINGAYEALEFITQVPLKEPPGNMQPDISRLQQYNQAEFIEIGRQHDLDTIGYIYVPPKCDGKESCLLHIYFHGCSSGSEYNGTRHIENSGYLQVAELNNIIILFPQAVRSEPNNLFGCWDTKGVTGRLYATKEGVQVKVIRRILSRLINERRQHNVNVASHFRN